jgi:thymidine kinase
MFLEPYITQEPKSGWIEVICGSMFSGKTEELIRRLKRANIANQQVIIFKPVVDTRYDENAIVSHDSNSIKAIGVSKSSDILGLSDNYEVIGIDEAQFFDAELTDVAQRLALEGKRVILAGLDMDYLGKPFGPIPALLAVSEYITKVHAICPHCGSLATHSYRKDKDEDLVLLGEKDLYEPRCRSCYSKGDDLQLKKEVEIEGRN